MNDAIPAKRLNKFHVTPKSRSRLGVSNFESDRWIWVGAALVVCFVNLSSTTHVYEALRERMFDYELDAFAPRHNRDEPVVIDIDRRTLTEFGGWPLSRERLAEIVAVIANGGPNLAPVRWKPNTPFAR